MARTVEGKEIPALDSATHTTLPIKGKTGCTLVASGKYFYVVGDPDSTYKSIHLKWDAQLVVTLTLWGCDQPLNVGNMDPGNNNTATPTDTADDSVTSGDWLQIDPSTAVIYNKSDDGSTGGTTVTNATVAVAGGTAGGCIYDLGNVPTRRLRIRAAVGGTGGQLRCFTNGKD